MRKSALLPALLLISCVSMPAAFAAGGNFINMVASAPGVITDAATQITQTSAQLNGRVNPNGLSTVASFRYGLSNTYGQTTSNSGLGSGVAEVPYNKVVSGLSPNTTYHFQASAGNTGGTVNGADLTFKTLPLSPDVTYDSVSVISAVKVKFYWHVNPHGAATTTKVQWGADTTYGNNGTALTTGTDTVSVAVTDSATTLTPNSVLYFRIIATNGGGSVTIGPITASTPAALPLAATAGATSITTSSAQLNGVGDGQHAVTFGWFDWNDDVSYSHHTSYQTLPNLTGSQPISAYLSNLDNGKSYYYRFTDSSLGGRNRSTGRFFTTLSSTREYGVDTQTVLLYHFDEHFVGSVQDYANDDHNATSFGTSLVSGGKYGYARKFNLSSDRIQSPSGTYLNFGSSSFTLECWVNPDLSGLGDAVLLNRGLSSSNTESFRLTLLRSGAVDLMLNGSGTPADEYHATTAAAAVPDDDWHHVAAVVDQSTGTVTIYVDGISLSVSSSGSLPSSLFGSTDPLMTGADHVTENPPSPSGSPEVTIDEIRVSKSARSLAELRAGGSIQGTVFNDVNSDQQYQNTEPGLAGWTLILLNSAATTVATATSDSSGNYSFENLPDGTYYVKEAQQSGWTQTYPKGLGYWKVTISRSANATGKNFGNAIPCSYIGPIGGRWSDPSNWSCGRVPSHDDDIDVGDNKNVDLDDLPSDSINTLRIRHNSKITFRSLHRQLKVRGTVQIDSGGTLTFPQTDDGTGVICTGDWVNLGSFDPGKSTITFTGNAPKSIIWSNGGLTTQAVAKSRTVSGSVAGNQFYNLLIEGDSVGTSGNITIQNQLTLKSGLTLQPQDTLFILNDSSGAISDTGSVGTGSISRAVRNGSVGEYRFESGSTSVQFTSSPAYPGTITETPSPDSIPRSWELLWEPVGGTVNLSEHTVTAAHVNHFSKWIVGKPGGKNKPRTSPVISGTISFETGFDSTSAVKRLYSIDVDANNGGFDATVALRYDPSEVGGALNESGLQLYRGPFRIDSVRAGWNLVSLPLDPDDKSLNGRFPRAISQAFAYSSSYVSATELEPGKGYWLKFPYADLDTVMGGDFASVTVAVEAGWNLIGGLSYQTSPEFVSSPDGVTFGTVYGYNHGYFSAASLEPHQGYWIKAGAAGHLTISAPPQNGAAPKTDLKGGAILPGPSDMGRIIITDAVGASQTLYYGSAASSSTARFELPPPPPSPSFDARFDRSMAAALAGERESSSRIQICGATYPVTVAWQNGSQKIAGSIQIDGKRAAVLAGNGSLSLSTAPLEISVRLRQSAPEEILPSAFALFQNYPNPFNPQTTIRFDLPADSRVSLEVFNVLGQRVVSLLAGEQISAGRHAVPFDASNLASGVYFYTLRAGMFSQTARMTLIR